MLKSRTKYSFSKLVEEEKILPILSTILKTDFKKLQVKTIEKIK